MADPENVANDAADSAEVPTTEDRSLLQKAGDALGLGGDASGENPDVAEPEPVVTDEAREETAVESEAERKKAIRKHMASNLGNKTAAGKDTNAGRRDPKAQPDFESSPEPESEE